MYGNGFIPPYGNMPGLGGMRGIGSGIGNVFGSGVGNGIGSGILGGASRGAGLFSRLGRGFNLGSILNNTQRTLNVINQAIPVVKQAGPMMNNMKTMFKLAGAFKDETDNKDSIKKESQSTNIDSSTSNSVSYNNDNQPEFFV